jgi:hypothetical protein
LLGKHQTRPQIPFLTALAMLGYGLAGAVSPYLGVVLRDQDPRLPFLISGVVVLLTTLALSKIERGAGRDATTPDPAVPAKPLGRMPIMFVASMVVLSLGSQLHFNINSAPFFLRFAKPDQLQWLLLVFWIGFNIAMFPASAVVKHRGGLFVVGAAGLLGGLAALGAELAVNLNMLIAAQFVAGAAWGCMRWRRSRRRWRSEKTAPKASWWGWYCQLWRWRPLRGWRRWPAACRSCRNTRRCCSGRRWRAGRSPAPGCW